MSPALLSILLLFVQHTDISSIFRLTHMHMKINCDAYTGYAYLPYIITHLNWVCQPFFLLEDIGTQPLACDEVTMFNVKQIMCEKIFIV